MLPGESEEVHIPQPAAPSARLVAPRRTVPNFRDTYRHEYAALRCRQYQIKLEVRRLAHCYGIQRQAMHS